MNAKNTESNQKWYLPAWLQRGLSVSVEGRSQTTGIYYTWHATVKTLDLPKGQKRVIEVFAARG